MMRIVETNRDADEEFLAYPAQVIVPANGKQTIRVTWLGAAKLTREQTYRIVVTQVPSVTSMAAPGNADRRRRRR